MLPCLAIATALCTVYLVTRKDEKSNPWQIGWIAVCVIWGIISAVAALCIIVVVVIILKRKKAFAVSLFSKENKLLGKKKVKVGEIVSITSLNGSNDMDFQIVKSEDDDGGDEFRVRFRKPEESQSVLKQKSYRIHLNSQWCDPIDMSNLSVDAGRLVFSDGDDEENANE